jgi:hypothetical protein
MNHHPIANGGLARWNELGDSFDFNKTDPARRGNGKARVIAIAGELVSRVLAGLENHLPFFAIDESAVHGDLGHSVAMVHEVKGKFTKGCDGIFDCE